MAKRFLICLLLLLGSCKNENDVHDFAITKFIRVKGDQHYSEISIINGVKYFSIDKSVYKNDSLTEYTRFRSEGAVGYSMEEIKLDTLARKEYEIVLKRKVKISDKILIDNNNQLTIDWIEKDSVICKTKDSLFLYQTLK